MRVLSFQSRHIQKMLDIPKQRVEYLALKIPIKPEIEEVEGTGRAHSYSFKNALQFAIAQSLSKVGLGMGETRRMLLELDSGRLRPATSAEVEWKLFDPDSSESGCVVITKDVGEDTLFSLFPDAPKLDAEFFMNNDVVIVLSLMAIKAKVLEYVQEG